MTGTILQLVSNQGPENKWINHPPQITFFKCIYRRHTVFATEFRQINFTNRMDFGGSGIIRIPRLGDLAHHAFLVFGIPELKAFYPRDKWQEYIRMDPKDRNTPKDDDFPTFQGGFQEYPKVQPEDLEILKRFLGLMATTVPIIMVKIIDLSRPDKYYATLVDPNFSRLYYQKLGQTPGTLSDYICRRTDLLFRELAHHVDIILEKYRHLFTDHLWTAQLSSYNQFRDAAHKRVKRMVNLNHLYFVFLHFLENLNVEEYVLRTQMEQKSAGELAYLVSVIGRRLDQYSQSISYRMEQLYASSPSIYPEDTLDNYTPLVSEQQSLENLLAITYILHRGHLPSIFQVFEWIDHQIDNIMVHEDTKGMAREIYSGIRQYFTKVYLGEPASPPVPMENHDILECYFSVELAGISALEKYYTDIFSLPQTSWIADNIFGPSKDPPEAQDEYDGYDQYLDSRYYDHGALMDDRPVVYLEEPRAAPQSSEVYTLPSSTFRYYQLGHHYFWTEDGILDRFEKIELGFFDRELQTGGHNHEISSVSVDNNNNDVRDILVRTEEAYCAWVRKLGHFLVSEVVLRAPGVVDRHTSDWFEVYHRLVHSNSGYYRMIGHLEELYRFGPGNRPRRTIYLPLIFNFSREVSSALPLVTSVQYELQIHLRKLEELSYKSRFSEYCRPMHLEFSYLWMEYIYLGSEERARFVQGPLEYLVEQLQREDYWTKNTNGTRYDMIYYPEEYLDRMGILRFSIVGVGMKSQKFTFALNAAHPVKIIIFIARRIIHVNPGDRDDRADYFDGERQWDNYGYYPYYDHHLWHEVSQNFLKSVLSLPDPWNVPFNEDPWDYLLEYPRIDPVRSIDLRINDLPLLPEDTALWTTISCYQTGLCSSEGVHVFSWALHPFSGQPSGSVNFSRIADTRLNLEILYPLDPTGQTGQDDYQITLFYVGWNVLRYSQGTVAWAWI